MDVRWLANILRTVHRFFCNRMCPHVGLAQDIRDSTHRNPESAPAVGRGQARRTCGGWRRCCAQRRGARRRCWRSRAPWASPPQSLLCSARSAAWGTPCHSAPTHRVWNSVCKGSVGSRPLQNRTMGAHTWGLSTKDECCHGLTALHLPECIFLSCIRHPHSMFCMPWTSPSRSQFHGHCLQREFTDKLRAHREGAGGGWRVWVMHERLIATVIQLLSGRPGAQHAQHGQARWDALGARRRLGISHILPGAGNPGKQAHPAWHVHH